MSELYNRDFSFTVGTVLIKARPDSLSDEAKETLRCQFDVEGDDNSAPNKATLKVWNLNESHRKLLQKKWPLVIEAGYVDEIQQIYTGDISFIDHRMEGVNWISTIESGDGEKAVSQKRFKKSYGANTSINTLLSDVAGSLGIGLGNLTKKLAAGALRTGFRSFSEGVVVNGQSAKILDKYLASSGYQWSIQDGQIQVLGPDETTQEQAIVLSRTSGLIGSPEVGEKGVVTAKSLLRGGIRGGRKVKVESRMVDGFFKCTKVAHTGDTWAQDWYTTIEGKPVDG